MLFGNSCAIKDASMLIYGYSSLANSAQIEWPSITKLMFNEIKAADLLELLRFLPNLAILKVASLDTEQMPQLLGKKEERYQLACSHSLTIAALIEYPRMGTASHFDEILIFITQSCSKLN
ncbi:hypothetical protein IWW36_001707 [Coemansia brasiliensis]|uniref:Uncharacterized protein n=1 Tax=Coemansia brasiliensis TaxID=2650707 RepID=A0A9W8IEV2_9FUNG|nr:hypothetical protein IWW36_001707 [Coemansia brasiliensis]